MAKTIQVHLRLDRGDYKVLQAEANEKRLPISTYIRMLITREDKEMKNG